MATYSDYKSDFNDAVLLLSSGIARLKRRRSKNWYEKLKGFVNAIAGGGVPSLDPNVSEVKSKTNIYSGAEAMNEGARKILDSIASDYNMLYNRHFKNFYQTSEKILKLKKGDDFSFENIFSSDETLDKIKQLFIQLETSDNTTGLIDENAPRNLVIKIFGEITNVVKLFSDSVNANISSLNSILNDLDNDQLSDHLEGSLINVCYHIYIFNQLTGSFTMAQAQRRIERRLEPVARPTGRRDAPPGDDGGRPDDTRGVQALYYSAEKFLEGRATSLERVGGQGAFKLGLPGSSDDWGIPIILSRKDGKNISSDEVSAINDRPIDFVNYLISTDVLEPVNIDADLITRNIKQVVVAPMDENSKLRVYIELYKEFKEKAYNEVADDGSVIFQINDTTTASPVGFVVKANKDNDLLKQAETATTPYYEAESPSGEKISFTPSDLIKGMGKLKDSSGKTFKPKKIKGKSLADKVMSKNFGKIRK